MFRDDTYRVALFGHRDFCAHQILDGKLPPLLKELIHTSLFLEIYIGRNGEFDLYAATIVKHVQREAGNRNNEMICVLPYPEKDMEYYAEYYDRVMIPERGEKMHPKSAITYRNRWIVEQADLLVCYVDRRTGGAYTALRYAEQLGKKVINFAEDR